MAFVIGSTIAGGATIGSAILQSRAAGDASRIAREQSRWQRGLSEKYLGMTEEDRARQWERYNRYVRPMESSLSGYAQKLMGGDISGGYARTLAEVDPSYERAGVNIKSRAARTGLSRTSPGLLQSMLAQNERERVGARLRVRGEAETGGQDLMLRLLSGQGQPQRISPSAGMSAAQSSGQFAMQGAGYDVMGQQALAGGIQGLGQVGSDLGAMYWLDQYMPKPDGGVGG